MLEIARSIARAAVHLPTTALPHCEIFLSPLNYSRYSHIFPMSAINRESWRMPMIAKRFGAERCAYDESLKMQKGDDRETKRGQFAEGHARRFSVLMRRMAKLLGVINIYARHIRTRRERQRTSCTLDPSFERYCYRVALSVDNCNRHSMRNDFSMYRLF